VTYLYFDKRLKPGKIDGQASLDWLKQTE